MQNADTPIAERRFVGDEGTRAITLRIWAPTQLEGAYPSCEFEFKQDSEVLHRGTASSLDSIDCLFLCLALAGTWVAEMNKAVFEGKLRWEGSPGGGAGLGLPTLEIYQGRESTSVL